MLCWIKTKTGNKKGRTISYKTVLIHETQNLYRINVYFKVCLSKTNFVLNTFLEDDIKTVLVNSSKNFTKTVISNTIFPKFFTGKIREVRIM